MIIYIYIYLYLLVLLYFIFVRPELRDVNSGQTIENVDMRELSQDAGKVKATMVNTCPCICMPMDSVRVNSLFVPKLVISHMVHCRYGVSKKLLKRLKCFKCPRRSVCWILFSDGLTCWHVVFNPIKQHTHIFRGAWMLLWHPLDGTSSLWHPEDTKLEVQHGIARWNPQSLVLNPSLFPPEKKRQDNWSYISSDHFPTKINDSSPPPDNWPLFSRQDRTSPQCLVDLPQVPVPQTARPPTARPKTQYPPLGVFSSAWSRWYLVVHPT